MEKEVLLSSSSPPPPPPAACARGEKKEEKEEDKVGLNRWAVNASFGLNVLLTVLKVLALVISGSMAMLASVVDSALDLLSGGVLFITQR